MGPIIRYAELLERVYPSVPWQKPLKVQVAGRQRHWWVCRICTARHGLKAIELGDPDARAFHSLDEEAVALHIAREH